MVHRLKGLVLAEEESSVSSTHVVVILTLVPVDLMPPSGILWYCTHIVHRHRCRQNIHYA